MRHGTGSYHRRTGGGVTSERENLAAPEISGQQGSGNRTNAGHRGGRYRGNEERDFKGGQANRLDDGNGRVQERRGGHHSNRRMNDEREVRGVSAGSGVVQRDAYGKDVEGKRLFVSNLAFETQWKYLKDHMRQAGDVVRADIFENKDGTSRGIGYVQDLFGLVWGVG